MSLCHSSLFTLFFLRDNVVIIEISCKKRETIQLANILNDFIEYFRLFSSPQILHIGCTVNWNNNLTQDNVVRWLCCFPRPCGRNLIVDGDVLDLTGNSLRFHFTSLHTFTLIIFLQNANQRNCCVLDFLLIFLLSILNASNYFGI